jgi:uncharacterized membrane-anchored protein YhcB (DUF1043 family)
MNQLTTGDILGIGGIVATFIVGITIYFMQRRADRRLNELTEELHRVIHHEDERKKSIKRYYIRRIKSDFDRIEEHYSSLKQHIRQYLENGSGESWTKLNRYADQIFSPRVDSFITVTNDIKAIVHLLDNPRLIDKYSLIVFHGEELKGYTKQLGSNQNRSGEDVIDIESEMDSIMSYIDDFRDMLMEEVDNKLD